MRREEDQPWDSDYYQTGNTKPPKDYTGILVVLLIVLVVYLGFITVKGNFLGQRKERLNREILSEEQMAEESADTEPSIAAFTEPIPETKAAPVEDAASGDITSNSIEISESPIGVPNVVQEGGLSLQEIYRNTIDTVVSISSNGVNGESSGTGIILTEDGFIVTNCHVVESGVAFTVMLNDETVYDAYLVGKDKVTDLAVLKISEHGLKKAELGDSEILQVGDSVVAIGDPLGIELRGTMTNGIISAINRDVKVDGRTMTLIQTNAALNSGNSGGPLLNCYGQVIGINTMKMSNRIGQNQVEGLGFAIPSVIVKEIVDQLISQGYVSGRPALDFVCETVTSFYQLYYNLPAGVFVSEIKEGSNADKAGLKDSDIILYVDEQRVRSSGDIETILYNHNAGDVVRFVIYRRSGQEQIEMVLEEAKN